MVTAAEYADRVQHASVANSLLIFIIGGLAVIVSRY
jgi:hypothetical protein